MKPVTSTNDLLNLIAKVKHLEKGYVTNFFPDIPKMELWIKLQLIFYEETEETVFLIRKQPGFNNLYFITTDMHQFSGDILLLQKKYFDELFVIDLIGNYNFVADFRKALEEKDFFCYTTLVRMSKSIVNQSNDESGFRHISIADEHMGMQVLELLREYFDPYAEQIPLPEEIKKWIDQGSIIIYSDDLQTIQGFLIFELTGKTSYLRYWFVHPEHREKKVGSALIKSFFKESKDSKRQLFWVIESNDNAIKRYEHYGFRREELYDLIMINKNIKYEG